MTQIDWWRGEGGNAYTARNRVHWLRRVPFWQSVVGAIAPRTVLEVGCNAGWNLMALHACDPKLELTGIEPNKKARHEAHGYGYNVARDWWTPMPQFDLVFTAGVLIHVPTPDLEPLCRRMVDASRQYVACIEYWAKEEEEIPYREQMGLLWKRPYGRIYEALGLEIVAQCHLSPEQGFDNCRYWLLEKPEKI